MNNRYVCVHGHFYQPPRENPSLEAIELQDSAYPYHDWNERITAECYAPNAASRILDSEQRIIQLINNYSRISFNFGPTLLSWLAEKAPKVYESILKADELSSRQFSGFGSATSQAYNHIILPLANYRDKVTQVRWGIQDFEQRFRRKPEGMWLPETAVNMETLSVLADNGIKFTILAPRQAKAIRRRGSRTWEDVTGERIDPSRAYYVQLPSQKKISVFFYDGPISQAVAFEGVLNDGKRFAERLVSGFSALRDWPQLVNIATDGESYGHHHHYGEMALTYALQHIEDANLAQLTNYAQFLQLHPPDHVVEIVDDSSWSCVHGIERWRTNCGCNSGGHTQWNQEWRSPLRFALDWLREQTASVYAEKMRPLLQDPWRARDSYISIVLDRSEASVSQFFANHGVRPLNEDEQVMALKLLELQRHAMLMYTSCGWFFDELSGLETVQVILYAGRVVELAKEFVDWNIEQQFVDHLRLAKSNLPEHGDGAQIYEKWVKPAFIDINRVMGHYAISSMFENYEDKTRIYCYGVERENFSLETQGKQRLATGRAKFRSEITRESAEVSFAVMHMGDQNIAAAVRPTEAASDETLWAKLNVAFGEADTTRVMRILEEEFNQNLFSLRSLFRDKQREIMGLILDDALSSTSAAYREIYERQAPMLRFVNSLGIPVPLALHSAAEIAVNSELRLALTRPELNADAIRGHVKEATISQIDLDITTLEYLMRRRLEKKAEEFASSPNDLKLVESLRKSLDLALSLPFPVVLWEVQNICYGPIIKRLGECNLESANGDHDSELWRFELGLLEDQLRIRRIME
jgi:alpha-amylase/alpha-mannosidase (GH57 family)